MAVRLTMLLNLNTLKLSNTFSLMLVRIQKNTNQTFVKVPGVFNLKEKPPMQTVVH